MIAVPLAGEVVVRLARIVFVALILVVKSTVVSGRPKTNSVVAAIRLGLFDARLGIGVAHDLVAAGAHLPGQLRTQRAADHGHVQQVTDDIEVVRAASDEDLAPGFIDRSERLTLRPQPLAGRFVDALEIDVAVAVLPAEGNELPDHAADRLQLFRGGLRAHGRRHKNERMVF